MQFDEFALSHVQLPDTFLDFPLLLVNVLSSASFFVFDHLSLESVSIAIDNLSSSMDLIVSELSLVLLLGFLNMHFSKTLFLVFNKVTSVFITVSVRQDTFAPKMAFFELSFICFVLESIGSFSTFLVFNKVSLIHRTSRFSQNTFSVLFATNEISRILYVQFQHSQLPFAVELVVFKLTLILQNAFESIDSTSVLFTAPEGALVGCAIFFLKGALIELIVPELTIKFLPICIDKFTIFTTLLIVPHVACIPGLVSVCDGSVDEFAILELSFKCTVFFFPDSFSMRLEFAQIALI